MGPCGGGGKKLHGARQRGSVIARLVKPQLVGVKMDDKVEWTQETGNRSRGKKGRRLRYVEAI